MALKNTSSYQSTYDSTPKTPTASEMATASTTVNTSTYQSTYSSEPVSPPVEEVVVNTSTYESVPTTVMDEIIEESDTSYISTYVSQPVSTYESVYESTPVPPEDPPYVSSYQSTYESVYVSTYQSTYESSYQGSVTYFDPEPVIVEQVLTPVNEGVDTTDVTELVIEDKYFNYIDITDRKFRYIYKYQFDYLAYLFFKININENLPMFYDAVTRIINQQQFDREEDVRPTEFGAIPPEDDLDYDTMAMVFTQLWNIASGQSTSVKNLIGFYIYFNRRLNFLPILVQGISLKQLFETMTVQSILAKLTMLGLYPISGINLFERLWHSYKFSTIEDGNKAEVKTSLREYIKYDINRDMSETYNGFVNKNDKLLIVYDTELAKYAELKTFKSEYSAYKKYKEWINAYNGTPTINNMKKYLQNLLPVETENNRVTFLTRSLISNKKEIISPNRDLWLTMQSFDTIYKINRLHINKINIRNMFIEFTNSVGFPLGDIQTNDYLTLWTAWVGYLNSKASAITTNITNAPEEVPYEYIYNELIWLTNAKFIINYLTNNNSFANSAYSDGANYINASLLKVYESLDELKSEIQTINKYVIAKDKRFSLSYIK